VKRVVCLLVLALVLAGCNVKLTPKPAGSDNVPAASSGKANELVELNRKVRELQQGGKYADAIPLAERSVELYERDLGPEHPYVAAVLTTLAELRRETGEHAKAEPLFQRALAIREKTLGPDHPEVATLLNELALLYGATGDYAKSRPLYQRALAIHEKVQGSSHPDVATVLNNLALLFEATGNSGKAEPLYLRALAIREDALGRDHPLVAVVLNNLAVMYEATGFPTRAEPLHQRALDIREKAFGPSHPEVAASLNNLAELYRATENYAKAAPLYHRALEVREKTLGPDHPKVAVTLSNLGGLYESMRQYTKAEPLYRRALAIREKAKGGDYPEVAASLNALASLRKKVEDYEQAASLYRRALRIQEKALGSNHLNLTGPLNNLASVYESAGDYEKAEPLYRRALAIREKTFGPDHTNVTAALGNLGALYTAMGDYEKAESFYRRALDVRERALGPYHPNVATDLNNLAALHREAGDYGKAEPLLRRALDIDEQALGPYHPNVATDLNNLGSLYRESGDYQKAKPLLRRALAIDEQALGPAHPTAASSLYSLALLYQATGEYANAEPLFRRALAIYEQTAGADHPETANVLHNLALLYKADGKHLKAEPLAQRALEIRERTFGPDHPAVAQSLMTLAGLAAAQQRYRSAVDLFKKGLVLQENQIRTVFPAMAEKHKPTFVRSLSGDYLIVLSLIHQHLRGDHEAVRNGLELVLRRKGAMIDAEYWTRDELRGRLSDQTRSDWEQLDAVRGELARLFRHKPEKMGLDAYRGTLAALRRQVETMEGRLAGESVLTARELKDRAITVDGVAHSLPGNSALVEFAKIRDFDFARGTWKPSERYVAFVLRKSGDASLADLGEAGKVALLVRRALEDIRSSKGVAGSRPAKKPRARPAFQASLRSLEELYAALWAPMEQVLGSVDNILISPDGLLNLIPFAALRDGQGRFLVERYRLAYLTSGKELAGGDATSSRPGSGLLLVANPAFDKKVLGTAGRGGSLRSRDFRVVFSPLPATEREGREIPPLVGVNGGGKQVLVGKLATESTVKASQSPRILHLATHGFFLSDESFAPDAGAPKASPKKGRSRAKRAALRPYENPLVRSGLALAGANYAVKATGGDDGILTALEIAGMDLSGTELVVLSACETGAGRVPNGEGVFGLRRAFALAGAKNLLMSLWPVSDDVTARQMKVFYQKIRTMPPAEALREAQLESLRELKVKYGVPPPRLWAPFILQGAHAFGQ
jgi:tetratricopeptide (TPR) repeat protein